MIRLLAVFVTLLLSAMPAAAQTRHALVIGIDSYAHVEPLQKARNDARAVAAALETTGFEVQLLIDSSLSQLDTGLELFLRGVRPGDDVLFFFAGHGVEVDGQNFLLPVDLRVPEYGVAQFLRRNALDVDYIQQLITVRQPNTTLLILDACRDNPFPPGLGRSIGGTRGLARQSVASGSFVLMSADVGEAALDRLSENDPDPNSVFTRALLPRLTRPGATIRTIAPEVRSEVLQIAARINRRQFPHWDDRLEQDFVFRPQGSCNAAEVVWAQLANSVAPRDFDSFIRAHAECSLLVARAERRRDALASARRLFVNPGGDLNARAGPGTEFPIREVLERRTELLELDRRGDWSMVAVAGMGDVWVNNRHLVEDLESPASARHSWHNPQLVRRLGLSHATFMPDGAHILGERPSDAALIITDTETGRRQSRIIPLGEASFKPLQVDPSGHRILVTQRNAIVALTLPPQGNAVRVRRHQPARAAFEAARFSPDGRTIAATGLLGAEGTVLLNADNLSVIRRLDRGMNDVGFAPDGRRLVITQSEYENQGASEVRLVEAASGRVLAALTDPQIGRGANGALEARFSPDGRRLVIAARDFNAYLADAGSGRVQRVLRGHELWVESASFSPDGNLVVTAAHDGTARIWDTATGRQIALLRHRQSAVVHAVFSAAGDWLITCALRDDCYLWESG